MKVRVNHFFAVLCVAAPLRWLPTLPVKHNTRSTLHEFSLIRICLMLWVLIGFAACAPSGTLDSDEHEIRRVREASNSAIAAHDTTALGKTLAVDYNVVTSRNAQSTGRTAMLLRFAADSPDVVYVRTPDVIRIFPEWKMASETGTWIGRWKDGNDPIELSGTYYAKWHKIDGQWMIRAEIFTPLRCVGGSFCDRSPI